VLSGDRPPKCIDRHAPRYPGSSPSARSTGDGSVVGSAEIRAGDPATLLVDVTNWRKASMGAPRAPYRIAVDQRDGTQRLVALAPRSDYSWHVGLPVPASEIIGVALVDRDGAVLCSGRFDAPS
jgi:hypothetical protein